MTIDSRLPTNVGSEAATAGTNWAELSPRSENAVADSASSNRPPMSQLAVNEITTYRWSFFEDVTAYREAGIPGIGIWRPKLVEFGEERGIDLIQESGLSVSSLSWAGGFTGSNGQTFTEALDDTRGAVRIAGRLKADCLVVISGSRSGHTGNHARRLLVDALKALADLAGEQQVTLAVQPMQPMFCREWTFLTTLDETLDVLSRCDHPSVGMAFNVYHLWREPELQERIPEIVPYVSTVQLSDGRHPPRSDMDRCQLGEGEIPLATILRAFLDADYQGFYEIEIWSDDLWNSEDPDLLKCCRSRFEALVGR